jgi:arsenate reductase
MNDKVYNVLILCTGNSARSIMAEAAFNKLGVGRFKAYSAGSQPTGTVHPLAIEQIQTLNYPVEALRSKSWDEFAAPDAPVMDFVITVCDKAAGEVCPVWPGRPITAYWGFEDPAAIPGDEDERRRAFKSVFNFILARIRYFLVLPLEKLDALAIKQEMDNIGRLKNDL